MANLFFLPRAITQAEPVVGADNMPDFDVAGPVPGKY